MRQKLCFDLAPVLQVAIMTGTHHNRPRLGDLMRKYVWIRSETLTPISRARAASYPTMIGHADGGVTPARARHRISESARKVSHGKAATAAVGIGEVRALDGPM